VINQKKKEKTYLYLELISKLRNQEIGLVKSDFYKGKTKYDF